MFIEQSSHAVENVPVRDRVAEANHRIANSLSAIAALVQHRLVGLRSDHAIAASEVRQILAEVRARVDAVARLHRILSDAGDDVPVDIGGYLQQIASELVSSLSSKDSVTLHFVCELGCRVAPDRALYLGLIVVELVTNALKYAHPAGVHGEIAIRCYRGVDAIVVDVSDDGVGFPEGFDPDGDSSSGLRLIRSLAEQIGGRVSFESNSLGCQSMIYAPVLTAV
jgi:two-component sensor histidine kinase